MWKYTRYSVHFIKNYLNNSFIQKAGIIVGSTQVRAWHISISRVSLFFFLSLFTAMLLSLKKKKKQTPKISYSFCQLLKSKQAQCTSKLSELDSQM